MKKNISINISGIIFHIEEDGYGKLKEYLESINSYFATYEDSSEIIADIESRVAEIFLSKLDDGKQIINQEDVTALITTMGTVADFEAIEDEEDKSSTNPVQEETSQSDPEGEKDEQKESLASKKLLRDEKRKILGGVASGLAYYFGIDPLWVRMIMIILLILGKIGGVTLIVYIILWIVMPGSKDLGEDDAVKKMYRDGDQSVMGGVASGIAAYFGSDVTVVRLLFVVSMFLGGAGFILYMILWMITPEAKTITEKMEMQGEPVTLSNIEQNVKNSLNVKEGEEESALVKVLLFPFRILSVVFKAIGEMLGPFSKIIIEGLRIFAGLVITALGVVSMISLIISLGVVFGIINNWGGMVNFYDLSIEMVRNSLPTFGFIAAFLAGIVPFLALTLLGISILLKRFVLNAAIGWSLFGIWVLGVIGLGISTRTVYVNFRNSGSYTETRTYDFKDEVPVFKLEYSDEVLYEMTNLKIRGHEDSVYRLDLKFQSHGRTRNEAKESAKSLSYGVAQNDNSLVFDSNFQYEDGAKFRAQELEMTLFVPYNKEFMMEEDLKEIIRNTINRSGYRVWQMENNKWMFTEEEGLECVTCEKSYSRNGSTKREKSNKSYSDNARGESMTFDLDDFNQLDISGNFDVFISQGSNYSIELKGRDKYLKKSYVKKFDDVLEIDMEGEDWDNLKRFKSINKVKVFITVPDLKKIKGSGVVDFTVEAFDYKDLKISLEGASTMDLNIESANDIEMNLEDAASVNMQGNAKYLNVDLSGAARLKGYDFILESAKVSTKDASSARVNVREFLEASSTGVSSIKYKGNPKVQSDEEGFSKIRSTD